MPSTSQLITGVPPVTSTAGASESDHSGRTPVKMHWSSTGVCTHPEQEADPAGVYL